MSSVPEYINQVTDPSTRRALQALFDSMQKSFTFKDLSLSGTLSVDGLVSLAAGLNTGNGDIKVFYNSEDLADDAELFLPDATQGFALISDGTEYLVGFVDTDGSVVGIITSTNSGTSDSDGDLCLHKDGTKAVVVNRLGSEKTVTCLYLYAA